MNTKGIPDSYSKAKLKRNPMGDAEINSLVNLICDHSPQNEGVNQNE